MSLSLQVRAIALLFFCAVLALPVAAVDRTYEVNVGTDEPDDVYDGVCETAAGQCTLRAAIMEANDEAPDTLHSISFSVTKVTLTSGLPDIIQPTVIDGGDGDTRVEIDGGGFDCFDANSPEGDASGFFNALIPEANNSRFENLVIYNCNGAAIELSGHGYAVYNNYIGTDVTGNAVAGNPNTGSGIIFSAALEDGAIPSNPLPLPDALSDIASIVLFIAGAAPNLPPTGIIENVISGNALHGVEIHGQYASTAIVFDNKIGVGEDGITQIANGTAGSTAEHGVYVYANAYLNFIGINNVIAGNDLDDESAGVFIDTGLVPFPNFVAGNDIGASKNNAYALDLGNGGIGIQVGDVRPTTAADPIDNPTDLGAVIGPGNIVGFNGTGGCTPTQDTCVEGGIAVTNSNSDGVRIWGNLVGISDPSSFIDLGNHGDGINVVGTNIEIGGETLPEGNLIASNDRHGLVIRGGTGTNRVAAHANYIGVTPFFDAGNAGHGIWLLASGTQIGGPAYANERNVIANNGGHAIRFDNGGNAFGNLIQQNEIYNIASGFLGIDLDNPPNTMDFAHNESVVDRSGSAVNSYTNWQQNTVTLTSTGGGGTAWELRSARDRNYRIDFYSGPQEGDAKTWLCEVAATTALDDGFGGGLASGTAACAAAGPGLWITATVTDISPTDVSPTDDGEKDRPGYPADDPVMNTSEFSAAIQTPDQVTFSSATYSGAENGGSIVVTLQRVGTVNAGGVSVDVADLLTGTATAGGVDYTFVSPATVSWAGVDATDKTVSITLVNDAILEGSETVNLQLQNPSGADLGTITSATVTIEDDSDPEPTFSINDAAGTEVSSPQITFTVTKAGATALSATVDYDVLANTATAADYSGTLSGTLTFLAGETTKDIVIDITDDTIFEAVEQFAVVLSNATNATISDNTGVGSINDNDTPTFVIDDVTTSEGNAGFTTFEFTVTLSNPTSMDLTVDWAPAPGTATTPADYMGGGATATFLAGGNLTYPVLIDVVGDTDPEANETFFINLSNPSAGTITDAQGVGTILNDDVELSIADAAATEGTDPTIQFTVTRSGFTSATTNVDFTVSPDTASLADYSGTLAGTLTFLAGETTKTIVLDVVDDAIFESMEQLSVTIGPSDVSISDGVAFGTISDNDTPTFVIDDVAMNEGDAGFTTFEFTVTLSNPTSMDLTVDWAPAPGTATTPADYMGGGATATFLAGGNLTYPVLIDVVGDTDPEANETFFINLSNASAGSITDAQGVGTIQNDDAAATEISITDAMATEGTDGSIVFTLGRAGDSSAASSVDYIVTPGTAGTPGDYVASDPLTGTVNFAIGEETASITLDVVDDGINEASETFTVELSNPVNALIVDASGTGTISDNDAVTISINDVMLAEGTGGTTAFDFTVSLSIPSEQIIQVGYATADNTATTLDADYADAAGTVTFNPMDVSEMVSVTVVADAVTEPDETFFVNLNNASAGSIADNQGVGTIQNDDLASSVTIDDPVAFEGGSPTIVFTVTRSGDTSVMATVDFAVTPGSAATPADYTGTLAGTLTFPIGETTQTIPLTLVDDTTFEPAEDLFVTLSNPVAVALSDAAGTGTINDNDPQPAISIDSVSQLEGNVGPSNFTFTVTLSNASSQPISVDFATSNGTADGVDYAANSGTINFAPGLMSQTIDVVVNGDLTDEADDTFFVDLTNAVNATILAAQGTGTIQNDDSATPTFSVNSVTMNEGDAGTTSFDFTVSLAPVSAVETTVDVATADGSAVAGVDYVANTQTLTFPAGTPTQTFSVLVAGDTTFEPAETFVVGLTNPTGGAAVSGSGTGTITNDDSQPAISVSDISQLEGDAGFPTMTFVVTLSNPSSQAVTVDWLTVDGTASTLTGDYADDGGTLTFAPGEVTKNAVVVIVGDLDPEADETFTVELSNATNATIADPSGTGTILDDDATTNLAIDDPAATEGTPTITFTVTRSGDTSGVSSVDYTVNAGTATTPEDYTASAINLRTPSVQTDASRPDRVVGLSALSGTLSFATGETVKSITLDIVDDTTFEQPETFTVTLSNPVGATITDGLATATLADDDPQPTISIGDVSMSEGDAGVTTFTFTVTLSNPSAMAVTVDYATADGTATVGGLDFMAANGTLTFAPGVVTQTIAVTVDGDTAEEPDETFTVNLSNPTNATIVDAQATGTIVDDDAVTVVAGVPALGAKELMLLASLLAAVALFVMRKM